MKNTIMALIVGSFLSTGLIAQDTAEPAINSKSLSSLKISPVQFGKSYFEMSLELDLGKGKSSIQVSPMVLLKKDAFEEFTGIQGEIQYRSYLKRINRNTSPDMVKFISDIDFYAGAYGLGLTFSRDYMTNWYDFELMEEFREEHTMDITSAEAGVFVGVKLIFGQRVVLDLLAGGGVRYSDISDTWEASPNFNYTIYSNDDVFDLGYYGVKPRLNLQIGITL